MNQRILIRHRTGSRAGNLEEFLMTADKELIFGRHASCDVRFDEGRDEFVSRRHMKLVVRYSNGPEFAILDLAARNGTFVNRRRVTEKALLKPGDVVQLGAGGPEFQFDVVAEDRITPAAPIEVLAGTLKPSAGPLNRTPVQGPREGKEVPAPATPARPVRTGFNHPHPRRQRIRPPNPRKNRAAGLMIVLAMAVLTWNFLGARWKRWLAVTTQAAREMPRAIQITSFSRTPAAEQIATQNASALVTVDHTWRLLDSASGRPLKQIYVPNRRELPGSGSTELVANAGSDLPVFVLLAGNRLQPLLTFADRPSYREIGSDIRGAGFVLASDGLIVTARSVTSPWRSPYSWPSTDSAGVVAVFDQQLKLARTAVIARRQFPRWLPVDTEFVLETLDENSAHVSGPVRSKGVSDSLIVHVSSQRLNTPAAIVKESDETELAEIRVDRHAALQSVAMGTASAPKIGDELVIASMNSRPEAAKLSSIDDHGRYQLRSPTGETGAPGTPIFDRSGHVVAVEGAGETLCPDVTFAIPIHRALESIGHPPGRRPSK
jgi:FHA domain